MRWQRHFDLLNNWHPCWLRQPIPAGFAPVTQAPFALGDRSLPEALREWISLCHDLFDWKQFNDRPFVAPFEPPHDDGHLILCVENQSVVSWGVRSEDMAPTSSASNHERRGMMDDPPVFVRWQHSQEPWELDTPTVSAFFLRFLIREIILSAPSSGSVPLTTEQFLSIADDYDDFGFPSSTWPARPTRTFCDTSAPNLLLETHGDEWLFVAARSPERLHDLAAHHRLRNWEHFRTDGA